MTKSNEKAKVKVVPCEVYSRVVGYFRPVSNWNAGKQIEFYERKNVDINRFIRRGCCSETHSPSELP